MQKFLLRINIFISPADKNLHPKFYSSVSNSFYRNTEEYGKE